MKVQLQGGVWELFPLFSSALGLAVLCDSQVTGYW